MSDAAAARRELDRLLATDAEELRAILPVGYGDRVERYVGLLLGANAQQNLTRIVEPDAVARLHLLDALSALPILDELAPRRALDLGSGGGVPGVVLALARPSVAWTLVDSARRKADALRAFVGTLPLTGAEVIAERAEVLGHDPRHRESHDIVVARACASLPVLLEYALPLVRVGGAVLAWKGPIADAEVTAGRAAAGLLGGGGLEVRQTGIRALGGHRFVLVRKRGPTPDRYPRRPGAPTRHPLA